MSFFLCPLQIKPLTLRPVKVSEDEAVKELSRPHRSNSKEQLIERAGISTFTGRGGGEVGNREWAGDSNIEAEIREVQ
ncbi:hypothetical protein NQZ68_014761 [Dissostichus eleginoides]|nr:hypothetical protein NQZ68_014761 [Dissostichus eleginoides]